MKKVALVLIAVGFLAIAGLAHAEQSGAATQTISGEVVDLTCYVGHGMSGAEHQGCAQKCIASGLPVGIKTADRLYLAVGSEHGTANETLASLAGKQVIVEGTASERDGLHLFAVKKVTAKS